MTDILELRSILLSLLILPFLIHPLNAETDQPSNSESGQYYQVVSATDGDTLKISNGDRVRLIGIDAPESRYNSKLYRDAEKQRESPDKILALGKRAHLFTKNLVEGKKVRLEFDVQILVERGDKVRSEPPGLKESERRFVDDLRAYCRIERDKSLSGKEVFLLRNLSRGKGISFFKKREFYPDFILWVKEGSSQQIVFIEPHGMVYAEAYEHDDKVRLHETLPELAKTMGSRAKMKDVTLDSFVISATPYPVLRTRYGDGSWDKIRFAEAHILFQEQGTDYDYMQILWRKLQNQPVEAQGG